MNKQIQRMYSGTRATYSSETLRTLGAAVLACTISMCLAATTCFASQYRYAVDEQPEQIGPNLWRFAVVLGAKPASGLRFAAAEFDFAGPTEGIEVDYDFSSADVDFTDDRVFEAIAPTLFNQINGFINGWHSVDLRDGVFSGVVYATAPLTAVHLMIEADRVVGVRRAPVRAVRGSVR